MWKNIENMDETLSNVKVSSMYTILDVKLMHIDVNDDSINKSSMLPMYSRLGCTYRQNKSLILGRRRICCTSQSATSLLAIRALEFPIREFQRSDGLEVFPQ